ncbi:MAG: tyrosine-type recombinase/integrase [Hyphomicrobiaceae bacterium]
MVERDEMPGAAAPQSGDADLLPDAEGAALAGRQRRPRRKSMEIRGLTASQVKAARDPGLYPDGRCLYLKVDANGSKRWVLRLFRKGERFDLGLGGADNVSLAQAREEAARLRSLARSGADPRETRRREAGAKVTFMECFERLRPIRLAEMKNAKAVAQWESTLKAYAVPVFGSRPIATLTRVDVEKVLEPIWNAKRETASRVQQRMSAVFAYARSQGLYEGDNPVTLVQEARKTYSGKQRRQPGHHPSLPWPELPGFLGSLRTSNADDVTKLALEFLIMTAARTGEVLGLTWGEVDMAEKIWTVPASRMKAGQKHRVPLNGRALAILEAALQDVEAARPEALVFPGRKGEALSNMVFLELLKRLGLRGKVTAHGFRATFKTWASEATNFPTEVVEAALAHTVSDKVIAAYQRTTFIDKRRELLAAWGAYATSQPMANVINLSAARPA